MPKPIDDHFLYRYRQLLDEEDRAFDVLEHAVEEGDRATFDTATKEWALALKAKSVFLDRCDYDVPAA